MLSEEKTSTTLLKVMLGLIAVWGVGWIEKKLFGHWTNLGIFIGWIVGVMIAYGIDHFRNSKRDVTEGERRGAGEQ
ncbi:hypothetical protein I6F30_08785 [Bradyrhizobium sp. NBAIM20]|uniref:hypothetical protein n=1 Tax=unclassified Bradyrhizobium TaxID=2631580 RepID=UPI001CD1F3A5|nr:MULTISPECIES: hypothetical protein [unclassified Bradyrhizobium]MCA1411253.1 hypothetical protein [Bradyrhizobium sp. NBAIM20]MCA1463777.1 hypothetical protein [Bradyrhizobium sp. NBAIM18]